MKSSTISVFALFLFFSSALSVCAAPPETVKFENEITEGLPNPLDVALGTNGALFVVDADGTIFSFDAENKPQFSFKINSTITPSALAFAPKGKIIVLDTVNSHVNAFSITGELLFTIGAPGSLSGQFKSARGVDADILGFIYVADEGNKRIQIFTPNGIFMRSIALLGEPADVTVDVRGNIYALLPNQGIIEKFSNAGQKLSEISGMAIAEEIAKTNRFRADPWGDLYLVQSTEERIIKIDQTGSVLISFGSEGNERGQFTTITGINIDATGRVFVADSGGRRIQIFKVIGPKKTPLTRLTSAPFYLDFDSSVESLSFLNDIFFRPGKGLYGVSDRRGTVTACDRLDLVIGTEGSGEGQVLKPSAVFVTLDGKIYVADTGNNRVAIFNADGTSAYQFGKAGNKPGQFSAPQGIVVNGKGMIYVADTGNNRVQVFNQDGIYLSMIGEAQECQKLSTPKSLAIDSKENLYVLDSQQATVKVFDENGQCAKSIGERGSGPGQFVQAVDITVDQNDNLYVADSSENRVQIFDPNGNFVLSFGSPGTGGGYFKQISSVAANDGKIYVVDYESALIQAFQYSPDGLIGRAERLYSTRTAAPPPGIESNDVLRYTMAKNAAYRNAIREFIDSLGFSENYLLRFLRIESVESLNDGQVKVTVSIPKYIPKEITPGAL